MSEQETKAPRIGPLQRAFIMQFETIVDCLTKQVNGEAAQPYLEQIYALKSQMVKMSNDLEEAHALNIRLTHRILDLTDNKE